MSCVGSIGTRPDTQNGRAFAATTDAMADRYVTSLGSGSEPRLLFLLGLNGVLRCSTSNSDTLWVRCGGSSGYRLGVGEDVLEIVERGIGRIDSGGTTVCEARWWW